MTVTIDNFGKALRIKESYQKSFYASGPLIYPRYFPTQNSRRLNVVQFYLNLPFRKKQISYYESIFFNMMLI